MRKTLAHLIGEIAITEGFEIVKNEVFIVHIEAEENSQFSTLENIATSRPELLESVIVRTGTMKSTSCIWLEMEGK